jgi:hypothetical protein
MEWKLAHGRGTWSETLTSDRNPLISRSSRGSRRRGLRISYLSPANGGGGGPNPNDAIYLLVSVFLARVSPLAHSSSRSTALISFPLALIFARPWAGGGGASFPGRVLARCSVLANVAKVKHEQCGGACTGWMGCRIILNSQAYWCWFECNSWPLFPPNNLSYSCSNTQFVKPS